MTSLQIASRTALFVALALSSMACVRHPLSQVGEGDLLGSWRSPNGLSRLLFQGGGHCECLFEPLQGLAKPTAPVGLAGSFDVRGGRVHIRMTRYLYQGVTDESQLPSNARLFSSPFGGTGQLADGGVLVISWLLPNGGVSSVNFVKTKDP